MVKKEKDFAAKIELRGDGPDIGMVEKEKDIVERLRELALRGDTNRPHWMREAADEIERLRKECLDRGLLIKTLARGNVAGHESAGQRS